MAIKIKYFGFYRILFLLLMFTCNSLFSQENPQTSPALLTQDTIPFTPGESISLGYDEQPINLTTGAISHIKSDDFNKGLISDPLLLIQAKVPGLQIYNRGGNPNAEFTTQLRGISSITQNAPLIVIDGVPGASIQNIDPNDIESITVLRDASSQAIYGIRASNGVIMVKTKRRQYTADTLVLEYQGQVASSFAYPGINIMNAEEFKQAGGFDFGSSTNWQDEITRTGISNAQGLALNARKGNTDFRVSGNYRNVQGILEKSGFDQVNIRANTTSRLFNDALKIHLGGAYTNRNSELGFREAFRYANNFNPTVPVDAADVDFLYRANLYGGYFQPIGIFDAFNPSAIVELNDRNGKLEALTASALLEYDLGKSISVNFRYAYQNQFSNERDFYSPESIFRGNTFNVLFEDRGRADFYDTEDQFSIYELFVNYNKTLGKTKLDLTLGTSYQEGDHEDQYVRLDGFSNRELTNIKRISDQDNLTGEGNGSYQEFNSWTNNISAFFGQARLNFANKFIFNTSLRFEGSSKLGENNRWGLFPSLGMMLNLKEIWKMQNLDQLSLRMGYGITGGLPQEGGLSKAKTIFIERSDGSVSEWYFRDANPELGHEQKNEFNLGVDFSLGNLRAYMDWYTREVKDWITLESTQFGSQYSNLNALRTAGIEIGVDYNILNTQNLSYTTGIILSTYQSEYTDIYLDGRLAGSPGSTLFNPVVPLMEGESPGDIWGRIISSIDENGDPVYADVNGDGRIFTDIYAVFEPDTDLAVLGNGFPDYELGWRNQFRYKDWQLDLFFRGAFGHTLYNFQRALYEPRSMDQMTFYNITDTELAVEEIGFATISNLNAEKASFLKLDYISIGKRFPIGNKTKLNLSIAGQNLLTFTDYTGPDPEPNLVDRGATTFGGREMRIEDGQPLAPGLDRRNRYLPSRTVVLGLGLTF